MSPLHACTIPCSCRSSPPPHFLLSLACLTPVAPLTPLAVAHVLGRPLQRIALGGVRDEAEIRGHRRTYVGAMPGRILQALKKARCRDAVVLLDEVDKMGRDIRWVCCWWMWTRWGGIRDERSGSGAMDRRCIEGPSDRRAAWLLHWRVGNMTANEGRLRHLVWHWAWGERGPVTQGPICGALLIRRGDPASALLEVLDPEQNQHFVDTYLGLPFPLEGVVFVCTANRLEDIPGPLLDRLEVIPISGYTMQVGTHGRRDPRCR